MEQIPSAKYDVVICGAGPAGLNAACRIATGVPGSHVVLLDRKLPWREPVSCAEAVSKSALERHWPVNEAWVRQHLDGVVFVSPDGTRVDFTQKECGFILNRAAFHKEMAETAAAKGVECHFSADCRRIFRDSEGYWNAEVFENGVSSLVRGRVLVDATGPGAKLTRNVPGLDYLETGNFDLEPAIFAIAEGIPHDPHKIELLFGTQYFPGGYGWVFPRDGKTVNVGLVNGRRFLLSHPPRKMLNAFLAERYPGAKVLSIHGGAIACGQSFRALAEHGVFKAGDAASCVNPISRSGIVEALKSGEVVACAVKEWLAAGTGEERVRIEKSVLDRWMLVQGKGHFRIAKAKPGFSSISDVQFDRAAHKLAAVPATKLSLFRIFFTVLCSTPGLLWKMRSFLF
ncbi:MAG: NAD(P)/FAD-dependent oxidoreductase [Fibrobacteraceae bacterium]